MADSPEESTSDKKSNVDCLRSPGVHHERSGGLGGHLLGGRLVRGMPRPLGHGGPAGDKPQPEPPGNLPKGGRVVLQGDAVKIRCTHLSSPPAFGGKKFFSSFGTATIAIPHI